MDDGRNVSTNSEVEDDAIIQVIVGCLQTTGTSVFADWRRSKRAKTEQATFPNETRENVCSGTGGLWFHSNLRASRRSFDLIAEWIEYTATELGLFADAKTAANARVD